MRVLGVDLATEPSGTGVVALEQNSPTRWEARQLSTPATDRNLVRAAYEADVIGVDAPLGWPIDFANAVAAHSASVPWNWPESRESLRLRETDREVYRRTKRQPLSVSADKLGAVAMRCARLQQMWGREVWSEAAPRDGSGRLVEAYPTAALALWGVSHKSYKHREPTIARPARESALRSVASDTSNWLDITAVIDACVESDHVFDALVCAIVVMATRSAMTIWPTQEQQTSALIEGWIHLPAHPLRELWPSPTATSH